MCVIVAWSPHCPEGRVTWYMWKGMAQYLALSRALRVDVLGAVLNAGMCASSLLFWGCGSTDETQAALTAPQSTPDSGSGRDAGADATESDLAAPPNPGTDAEPTESDTLEAGTVEAAILDAGPREGGPPEAGPDRDAGVDASGMRCNGDEALCDRRFDEVVFPATHNAMSNADDGWVVPNQTHPMLRQLQDGIRAMLIDTYSNLGTGYLCHSSCLIGSRKLVDALSEMADFLRAHPNEVLTLVIEDHLSAADTETAFVASGLVDFVYIHPSGAAWPTLRTMIASGHRVVVGAEMGQPPPAWYHHFYDLAWDTPYTFKSVSEFSCAQNRGVRTNALFLLNHWIENPFPSEQLSQIANAHDTLLGRARQCQQESGKLPNFVAVNHYSVGDLFQVVRELNGL